MKIWKCKRCGETKSRNFYHTQRSECKRCQIQRSKKWIEANPIRIVIIREKYKPKKKEYQKKYFKKWWIEKGKMMRKLRRQAKSLINIKEK